MEEEDPEHGGVVYLRDPDGNLLEISYERPDARAPFRARSGDRHEPLVIERARPA